MFNKTELERVVSLQARRHALLQWVSTGVAEGRITFQAAHASASTQAAAQEWVQRHLLAIPSEMRPALTDIPDFSGLFSTYLENSFELVQSPGQRLYSPDAHCFCKMCSWLVDVPHLQPRRLLPADKKRAQKLMRAVLERLVSESGLSLQDKVVEALANDAGLRESLALCAYRADLFQRVKGIAIGPAALALWRTFAWLPAGSPKKKFRLTAELITEAESLLRDRVASAAPGA